MEPLIWEHNQQYQTIHTKQSGSHYLQIIEEDRDYDLMALRK